ncbi:MAG: YfaZ family outer membrane protein [Moritella sp.]|uniref:YfaZ family outer membrane protein n=1 Tax=Moritella sp. TaxID=78556 RepID=UPI0029A0F3C3|nr:YfaZ family outer membrane protein [Moritella sp.]MDX2319044.1 YfaZ family outer membrane protein [Moritella sp.]
MSLKKSLVITAGLLASFSCAASNISLAFDNDNIVLGYDIEMQEALKLKGDYLQTIDNGYTVDTGLYAFQDAGATFFELGAKAMRMDNDNGDGYALAFGGLGGLRLTEEFSLEAEFHYSPEILAFGDTENYTQWVARASYAVMPTAHFFVEYNHTTVTYDKMPDERLTADVLFGLAWIF